MSKGRNPRLHTLDERNRAIHLAESPRPDRQVSHRVHAGVLSEAKGQVIVAAGLEQGERTFQMIPRFGILAGEPASYPGGAISDAGLGRVGPGLEVAKEGRCLRSHRWQVASCVAAGP
jgi:hypothetical protein